MEDIQASIAAVSRKEEAVEQALSGEGSYLGLILGEAAGRGDGERKELLMHLQALRDEKMQLRDQEMENAEEKAGERAFEREKELLLLRLQAQQSAATSRSRSPHTVRTPRWRRGRLGETGGGGRKWRHVTSGGGGRGGGRAASHRLPLPGSGACASAFGMEEVYAKVMELVGGGEYAFVATVCWKWREYYIVEHAAMTSHARVVASIERVYWARRHGYELTVETFRAAAQYGDVSICKALFHMGCPWDVYVCSGAASNERHSLSVLKWLRSEDSADAKEEKCPWTPRVCAAAALRGNLQLLEWLLSDDVNAPFSPEMWNHAAARGHVSLLAWLLSNPKVKAELEGAEEGSKWRSGPWIAAANSQLETLRWLHTNARELGNWTADVCAAAVYRGESLEMLQWLRSEEVGCAWDFDACPEVVKAGLVAEGFPWSMKGRVFEEIKQWVHANGHPCDCED